MDNNKKPRVGPLDTLGRVRGEMAKIYRESRRGGLEVSDLTKLTYALKAIADLIVRADLEERVSDLERSVAERAARAERSTTHRPREI